MRLGFVAIVVGLSFASPVLGQTPTAPTTLQKLNDFERRPGPGGYTLIRLASKTIIAVMPGDLDGESLKTTRAEQTCIAAARVTLASGLAVFIPLADMADGAKIGRRSPIECRQEVADTATTGSVPTDVAAMGTIRAKCAADWKDDFTMRNFCEEQQLKALDELRRR